MLEAESDKHPHGLMRQLFDRDSRLSKDEYLTRMTATDAKWILSAYTVRERTLKFMDDAVLKALEDDSD